MSPPAPTARPWHAVSRERASFAKVCYSCVVNISLTPELEKYVRRKVASGLYNNASEVVREALRALVDREAKPVGKRPKRHPRKAEILATLAALEKPLRERGLASLALFGSTARDTARADSDVDVLIDIAPGFRFSLIDLAAVKDLLEDRLGHSVDVVIKNALGPSMRDHALREAEPVF